MAERLVSLDQFRGYTVLGMFLVNHAGGYPATPELLKHHDAWVSYADTIMPQFFFAVGYALRLAHGRRVEALGARAANLRVLRRAALLALVGAVIYHDLETWRGLFSGDAFRWVRLWFQTLTHIAATTVFVLPVILSRPRVLVATGVACALVHLGLSIAFYTDFALSRRVIDGGPLGFLSWALPTLAGAWAHDSKERPGRLALVGGALSLLGIALARQLPFVESAGVTPFTMSQRTGSVSYLAFGAGFSLIVFAAFVLACDRGGFSSSILRTLGRNALAGYILHGLVSDLVKRAFEKSDPFSAALLGAVVACAIVWLVLRLMEARGLYLKL